MYDEGYHGDGDDDPPQPVVEPRKADLACQVYGSASLEYRPSDTAKRKGQESDPMAERASRKVLDKVSLWLAGELVSVPGDDEEILHILPYRFAVDSPKWCHRVQEERECVETNIPKLLIVIPVALFQRGNLREL